MIEAAFLGLGFLGGVITGALLVKRRPKKRVRLARLKMVDRVRRSGGA